MLPLLKYVGSIVEHNSQTQNKLKKKEKKEDMVFCIGEWNI